MNQSVTWGLTPWHLECIPEYQSATKYTKTCHLHCTPVSVSNAGYSCLSPGLYTGVSVSDKDYQDQCHPVYQSVTQGIAACHSKCIPEYQSATKYMKTATLYPDVSVSNLGYTLRVYRSTGISVSAKYRKNCQLHCSPVYQSVTQGKVACHLKYIPEYQSETKCTKTCQLHCTPKYQSVTQGKAASHLDQNICQWQSIIRSVSYTVSWYSRLSPGVHTRIPVSDKV